MPRTLYWGSGSAPAWRVQIALAEKGLVRVWGRRRVPPQASADDACGSIVARWRGGGAREPRGRRRRVAPIRRHPTAFHLHPSPQPYESVLCSFAAGEHKQPAIMAVNPRGQVPTLVDDDGAVACESVAAVLYLDARYPESGTRLVPTAGPAMAVTLQRSLEVANLDAAFRGCVYPRMRNLPQSDDEAAVKLQALRDELARWEAHVAGGAWLAGEPFTAADAVFAPLLLATIRFGATLAPTYPHLAAYAARAAARPSVAGSWPPHWKEGAGPGFLAGV